MTEHATQNAVHRRSDRGAVGVGAPDPTTDGAGRRVPSSKPSRSRNDLLHEARNVESRSISKQETQTSPAEKAKPVRSGVGISDVT